MIIHGLEKNKNQIKGDKMDHIFESIGFNFYIKLPNYWYLNMENNFKNKKKIKFSTTIPKQVNLNRKMFSEKRGRVLEK